MSKIRFYKYNQLNGDFVSGFLTVFITLLAIMGLFPSLARIFGLRNVPQKMPRNLQNLKNFDITNYFNKIKSSVKNKLKMNLLSDKNFIKKVNDISKKININLYKIRLQTIIDEEDEDSKISLWKSFLEDLREDINSNLSNDEQYFTGYILSYFLDDYNIEDSQTEKVYESKNIKRILNKILEKKLTAKARKHIKPENFVFPKERKYPIHDLAHARNALARVSAHGTPEEKKKVRDAVYRKYPGLKKRKEKREG